MRARGRAIAVGALAAIAIAAAPASAFEVSVPAAAPADVRAGQRSDVTLRIELSDGQVKDVDIHFPPGLVGDPNATPRCTHAQFEGDGCPPETKVGTSRTEATLLAVPQTLNGEIFNLQPRADEPARLGIVTETPNGPLRLESPVYSRPSDGGLDSQLRDIPSSFSGFPITITALETKLLGTTSTGRPFMQNPTSCGRAETVVDARSHQGDSAQGRGGYESTECQALPFDPTFEATVGAEGETARLSNPPLATVVAQTPGQANVRRVAVKLPSDIAVAADRLRRACVQADFDAGACAPTARIGEATAITPLLTAPLQGPVTFVAGSNTLPDLVLSLRGPLSLTLRGTNAFAPGGQITTFDGIPDVPLSRFELRFLGGGEGLLAASRDLCQGAPPRLSATFTSHAGTAKTVDVPAAVVGCRAAPPPPPIAARGPRAAIQLGSLRRGRPSLRLVVTAGDRRVRRVRLDFPRGLRLRKGTRLRGARLVARGRAIEIGAGRRGARRVTLTLRTGTLAAGQRLRRARRLRFRVRVTDTAGTRTTRRVRARPRRAG
ncbi:MAG TPA: hypothetical protein VHF89_12285 [Solirubrobacteraceae bacterium]|nr:hypothetical protein [Solirubrobacteraceae bacterium]